MICCWFNHSRLKLINQPKSKRKIWVWVEIFGPVDKPIPDMLKWLRSSQLISTVHNQPYATRKNWLKWLSRKKDWHALSKYRRKTDMPLRPTFIFPIELRCDINLLILFSERGLACTFHFYFSLPFTLTLSTTYSTNKTKLFVK